MDTADIQGHEDSQELPSRRRFLGWSALAAGGALTLITLLCRRLVQYVVGPGPDKAAGAALVKAHEAALQGDLGVTQIRLQRINQSEIAVASLSEIEPGQGKLVTDYFMQPAIILPLDGAEVIARSAVCTHLGCTVQAQLVEGKIFCPCHASYFDVATGRPLSGPATEPLAQEPTAVRGDTIYLVRPNGPVKIGPSQEPGLQGQGD